MAKHRKPIQSDAGSHTPLTLEPRIRERAYEIYVRNGFQDGRDIEDWLEAEREILAEAENRPAAETLSIAAA